jgi:hypothetical protein
MPWAVAAAAIGAGASLYSSSKAAKASKTGFNYLSGANAPAVASGNAATSATGQLLGTEPMKEGTQNAYNNYLNSTGYNFQRQQGTAAITGSAAYRGSLNSGATGKQLEEFGQNIGGGYFKNYLNQLGDVSGRGLTASGATGQAGTTGGVAAGGQIQSGGSAAGGMIAGGVGQAFSNYMNTPGGNPQGYSTNYGAGGWQSN